MEAFQSSESIELKRFEACKTQQVKIKQGQEAVIIANPNLTLYESKLTYIIKAILQRIIILKCFETKVQRNKISFAEFTRLDEFYTISKHMIHKRF